MSKTEEQAKELKDRVQDFLNDEDIKEYQFQDSGIPDLIEGLLIKFANSQHEQLTKERDELKKESKSSLNRIIGDLTKELQTVTKELDELKDDEIISETIFENERLKREVKQLKQNLEQSKESIKTKREQLQTEKQENQDLKDIISNNIESIELADKMLRAEKKRVEELELLKTNIEGVDDIESRWIAEEMNEILNNE